MAKIKGMAKMRTGVEMTRDDEEDER